MESNAIKCSRIKIDFNTPRTQEAASQLSISFKDCVKRQKSEFFEETTDERIAQLAYERHCMRVADNIKEIYQMRREIVKKQKKKEESNVMPVNSIGPFFSKNSPLRRQSNGNISPGHFVNPIKEIFMAQDEEKNPKQVLSQAERKEMKDTITKVCREMKMIMKDQHKDVIIREKKSRGSVVMLTKSPRRESSPKSTTKSGTKGSPIITTKSDLPPPQPVNMPENHKTEDKGSKDSESESENDDPEPVKIQMKSMNSSSGYNVKSAMAARAESRKKVLKRMAEKEAKEKEKLEKKEREWEERQSKLQSLMNKCIFIDFLLINVVDRVENSIQLRNTERLIVAARSSSNSMGIREKAKENRQMKTQANVESYLKKAEKIEECKRKRQNQIQEVLEKHKKELIEKKQKQEEELEKKRQREIKQLNEYEKNLETRSIRTRQLINKAHGDDKKSWKDLMAFNSSLQKENFERLQKRNELKRKMIWNSHKDLKTRNEEKNTHYQTHQCMVRAQSISLRKGKEQTYQFLNAIRMADPTKEKQREKLIEAVQVINNKLGFGINFDLPDN